MTRQPLIVASVLLAAVLGCQPKPAPVAVPERVELASPSDIESLRSLYRQNFPESQVGVVIAVKPDAKLVAVGGVDLSKMAEGQVVTFIDSHQKTLGTGRIVRVLSDSVHVGVEPNTRRNLVVGDLMVRF